MKNQTPAIKLATIEAATKTTTMNPIKVPRQPDRVARNCWASGFLTALPWG